MNRFITIILILALITSICSILPTASLYLKKDVSPTMNSQVVEKLKDNSGDYFAFIVLGDIHSGLPFNDSAALKEVWHINREGRFKKIFIDFVAISGDLTFRGSEWDYRTYNKIRSMIRWPVISGIGNHDNDNNGEARFERHVGRSEFSFVNRNSYFIVLNNIDNNLSDEQFVMLEEELKKSQAYKHRFIITHKSPISLYQQSWYRPELSEWSYRFMKMCEAYKVDLVLTGHEHIFKDAVFGGVRYIMSGGGGMLTQVPGYDGGFLNYVVVRVYGDYVDYEVRKIFPPLWEFLTYYMWKDVFYFLKGILF